MSTCEQACVHNWPRTHGLKEPSLYQRYDIVGMLLLADLVMQPTHSPTAKKDPFATNQGTLMAS